MSFLFPRTIRIDRAAHQGGGAGKKEYGGLDLADDKMTEVAVDIPASVQAKGTGRSNPTGLPADPSPFRWVILVPDGFLAEGQVVDGDIITDDLGRRFHVSADYVHSMGWTINAERLET